MSTQAPVGAPSTTLPSAATGGRPLRVLIANPIAELGGAEQVVLALAERLPALGIEAAFALLKPGPLEKIVRDRGIAVHVFPHDYRYRDLRSIMAASRWLADRIREEKADILHSNLTAHFIGSSAARRAKVRELWHLHDYPFQFDPVHFIGQRLPTNFALFTTQFLQSGEPRLRRGPHGVVNPNCVDVVKLQSTPGDPTVRERLGLGTGPFFLTVTRLQEHKGHTYLIDAAAQIAASHPEVRWVITGRARGEEQEAYLAGLRQQIAAKGLEDRFVFLGFVQQEDLAPIFREAMALVHPAITEGYGLVILEAMSYNLPVLAAAATGPAEILTNEENGLLVPTRDSAAMAGAMRRLLEEPGLAEGLRTRADLYVRQKSVDVMVAETAAIYRKMLGGQ